MFSFASVQDVNIFHGVNFIFFEGLDVIISSVEDVILFHGINVIIFEGLYVIIFYSVPYMLSLLKHWVWYHFLGVIIYFMLSFDVIISHSLQMLSFLCSHFSLYRMGVIIYVII